MKTTEINSIRVTTSKKIPPWAGYVSPTCVTVKVGNQYVTVQKVSK